MNLQTQIETLLGLKGKWDQTQRLFRIDPVSYGYLNPVQRVELEGQGVRLISSPLSNSEWWHWFMPVSSCPRYKGHLVEIADRYDPFCKAAACAEACGAEDQFVDLSAGRLRLIEEAGLIERIFPRLQLYLQRAESLAAEVSEQAGVGIMLDYQQGVVSLHSRLRAEPASLERHIQALRRLYPMITGIQGKVSTAFLPQPQTYSQDDLDQASILEEARYYALVEAVRQEALDILDFLLERKGGHLEDNVYHLPNDNLTYTLYNNRIEANRNSLYMGAEGFQKGVQELQKFFQTTLGGGRW